MSDASPTADMLALWAAEQLWDWRVRLLFAVVCVVAALAALFVYLKWGRNRDGGPSPKARKYFGRIAVTTIVILIGEASFFKDSLATALLAVTALVIGIIGLRFPQGGPE